jgi:DNA polymerase elongation subunit (family B)
VAELYEMRRVAKSKKEYDIVEKAIKLTLNSLYGKTVQSVGGERIAALD